MSSSNRTDNANNNHNKGLLEAIRNHRLRKVKTNYNGDLVGAIRKDQYDKVKNILEHHRDNIDINGYIEDDSKYTILREACWRRPNARIVALLLEYGADPNHGNELVEMNGERYYSNANSPIWCRWINPRSRRIRFIVQKDILSIFLRYGADPNVIHPQIGWSPLHSACHYAEYDKIELLLRHGANPNQLDRDGISPMFDLLNTGGFLDNLTGCFKPYVLCDMRLPCLRLLLEYGADPSVIVPKWGMTPLFQVIHRARGECRLDFIRLLMQHGADVTIPLSMKPSYIDFGYDCGNCIKGDTVLHAAVRLGDVDAIRLMTESHAITSFWWLRNDDGDTVYDLAAKSKDATPIMEYFDMKWQQFRQQCYAYLLYDWIPKSCSHS